MASILEKGNLETADIMNLLKRIELLEGKTEKAKIQKPAAKRIGGVTKMR